MWSSAIQLAKSGGVACSVFFLENMNFQKIKHNVVYLIKYAYSFAFFCCVHIISSYYNQFIHMLQGCFTATDGILGFPSISEATIKTMGNIEQCLTKAKHSQLQTMFLGCTLHGVMSFFTLAGELDADDLAWISL